MTPETPILSVNELHTEFPTLKGPVRAVNGVSFDVKKGETLCVVGESGSGKSVLNLSIMRLVPPPGKILGGEIIFDGIDIRAVNESDVRKLRGRRIAAVFQDPMTSLNPYLKISTQLAEITRLHLGHSGREAHVHAIRMLEKVGIADASVRVNDYPHEFSGGMRQRVMIAMALSCDPELLIADEPTTALDVTVQAQILELMRDLKSRLGTSVILVTHDLGVVAGMADRVIVMYAGRVFETAPVNDLFARPANPYTVGLLKSMPDPSAEAGGTLYQIPGMPPNLADPVSGCPFAERCDRAQDVCRRQFPPFVEVGPGHGSLCHFANDIYSSANAMPTVNFVSGLR